MIETFIPLGWIESLVLWMLRPLFRPCIPEIGTKFCYRYVEKRMWLKRYSLFHLSFRWASSCSSRRQQRQHSSLSCARVPQWILLARGTGLEKLNPVKESKICNMSSKNWRVYVTFSESRKIRFSRHIALRPGSQEPQDRIKSNFKRYLLGSFLRAKPRSTDMGRFRLEIKNTKRKEAFVHNRWSFRGISRGETQVLCHDLKQGLFTQFCTGIRGIKKYSDELPHIRKGRKFN